MIYTKKGEINMKEEMFVIATRGKNNKEIYLAVDETKEDKNNPYKVYFRWTEDVEEALSTFNYSDVEETAKHHFKNFNKWYITTHSYDFK